MFRMNALKFAAVSSGQAEPEAERLAAAFRGTVP